MPISNKNVLILSSGYQIPVIGLGTYFSMSPVSHDVENAVKTAIQVGYRHIDCAAAYKNEVDVGRGVKASGVDRKEIFITSKLWNTEHSPENVGPALEKTLQDLGTDYLDLYLMHWPVSFVKRVPYNSFPTDAEGNPVIDSIPISSTWAAMEDLVSSGKVRSIGVSNFSQAELEKLLLTAKIIPAVNQIEAHPYLQQREFTAWCLSKNIQLTAYSPLGANEAGLPKVVDDAEVIRIAQELDITPAQLVLSWAVQRGTSVVPKSTSETRIRENFNVFELPSRIVEKVNALERHYRFHSPTNWGHDIFDEWEIYGQVGVM